MTTQAAVTLTQRMIGQAVCCCVWANLRSYSSAPCFFFFFFFSPLFFSPPAGDRSKPSPSLPPHVLNELKTPPLRPIASHPPAPPPSLSCTMLLLLLLWRVRSCNKDSKNIPGEKLRVVEGGGGLRVRACVVFVCLYIWSLRWRKATGKGRGRAEKEGVGEMWTRLQGGA